MGEGKDIHWQKPGRWLAFVLAGLLILVAIPMVFDHDSGATAGWNIFLGLLIAGAVGSGYRRADRVATLVALVMLARLVIAVALVPIQPAMLPDLLVALLACATAYDLRRQARAA